MVRNIDAETKQSEVRLLESFETFRLMGWGDEEWQPGGDLFQDHVGNELLMNMSGNAFSQFHLGPWMLASLATYGKFHGSWSDSESVPLGRENEMANDDSSSASSSSG